MMKIIKKGAKNNHPVHTSRDGVFICGAAEGPKAIGESVIQACAAASHAAALLSPVRGSEFTGLIEKKLFPVKATDEPKIAVVIDQGVMSQIFLTWSSLENTLSPFLE